MTRVINIRWLGAFRGSVRSRKRLRAALLWEMEGERERAAEPAVYPTHRVKGPVGFVFSDRDVKRKFRFDTWSEPRRNGCLKRHRLRPWSDHGEVWLKKGARPLCIVFKRKYSKNGLIPVLKEFGRVHDIPVVEWGQLPSIF